jgi:hypothetical protein
MARGHPMSAAARAKLSARMKGHGWGGKRHVGGHKGHKMSAKARENISKALKGKKHSHKGHSPSADTRAKIAAALRAHYAATASRGTARRRAVAGGRRSVSTTSLKNLRRRQLTGPPSHAPVLKRGQRTHKFHSGTHRLIMSHKYRSRKGLIHRRRKHRTRIVIHRYVRHHRVWRKRRRR